MGEGGEARRGGDLQRHDPAAPVAEAGQPMIVDQRTPEELEGPWQHDQREDPQALHGVPGLAQDRWHGDHGEAEGQPLGEVERADDCVFPSHDVLLDRVRSGR